MSILTYFSPHHALHNPPHEFMHGKFVPYFEMPARIDHLRQGLEAAGLVHIQEPVLQITQDDLAAVHDPAMIAYLEMLSGNVTDILQKSFEMYHMEGDANGYFYESSFPKRHYANTIGKPDYYIYDSTSPVGKDTWQAILYSANLAYCGALALLHGEKWAYAMCRPPGHHAGRDFAGGYCYLNNAAIAAGQLLKQGRVAIVDVDYHHGNGTQDIFWDEPRVFFASLHADPAVDYPYYSGYSDEIGGKNGSVVNVALPHGTGESEYLSALEKVLAQLRDFQPDFLIVSLGFDTYKDDPMARFQLDMSSYQRMGELFNGLQLPTLYVQEGGYCIEKLGEMAVAFFQGVLAE
jgi:acetoin utilization deacetylase AcuC-like enzyme